nr:MAG TPA: hypothetical protein [Caudoviricetes sp.]
MSYPICCNFLHIEHKNNGRGDYLETFSIT